MKFLFLSAIHSLRTADVFLMIYGSIFTPAANRIIPAGSYAIACGRGGLDNTEGIYDRLFAFIKKKNCLITGNAWEECLIDEVGSSEKDDQVTRIRIPVRFEA